MTVCAGREGDARRLTALHVCALGRRPPPILAPSDGRPVYVAMSLTVGLHTRTCFLQVRLAAAGPTAAPGTPSSTVYGPELPASMIYE